MVEDVTKRRLGRGLAALIGDVGEAAGRQKGCGGKKTERMAAMDHGRHRKALETAAG